LKGHTSEIYCIGFSKTKNILCSGSEDLTVRIWDADSLNCYAILYDYVPNNAAVNSLAFSKNGQFLCSGDSKGCIIIRQTDNLHNFIKLMQFISALEKEDL
jgi:WD40 repeat protein